MRTYLTKYACQFCLVFASIGALIVTVTSAHSALAARKSFSCTFANGQTWSHQNEGFKREAKETMSFIIANMDIKAQTAKVVTGSGVSQARVVQALDATHFIELTVGGYMNITTIFDTATDKGARPAVHSRHLGIVGQPIVSQFVGDCRIVSG